MNELNLHQIFENECETTVNQLHDGTILFHVYIENGPGLLTSKIKTPEWDNLVHFASQIMSKHKRLTEEQE